MTPDYRLAGPPVLQKRGWFRWGIYRDLPFEDGVVRLWSLYLGRTRAEQALRWEEAHTPTYLYGKKPS